MASTSSSLSDEEVTAAAKKKIYRINTNYNIQFGRHKKEIMFCEQCDARVEVGRFASHLKSEHSMDCKTACPFCYTKVKWKKGDLSKQLFLALHRKPCLQKFLKTHKTDPTKGKVVASSSLVEVTTTTTPKENEDKDDDDNTATNTNANNAPIVAKTVCSLFSSSPPLPPPPPPPRPYFELRMYRGLMPVNESEFCPTCYHHHHRQGVTPHMDGRTRRSDLWSDSFYEPFPKDFLFFQDRGPKHVRFTEQSGLGLVAYNMFQCFFSGDYAFYHLMVRARLWRRFYTSAKQWPGVHFSPYACLCDGKHADENEEDDGRVHHRHMIVAVESSWVDYFKKRWRSVVYQTSSPPPPEFQQQQQQQQQPIADDNDNDQGSVVRRQRNKLCITIDQASHLMYAIAYVSRKRASCDGYGNEVGVATAIGEEEDNDDDDDDNNNENRGERRRFGSHYWIFRELSPCAVLSLATLFEEGHATLVSRRRRDKDLSTYYYHVERVDNAWKVRLCHLSLTERKCVLPFAKEYELCDEFAEDRPAVFLYGCTKYLKSVPGLQNLNPNDWLRHQIRTGNSFWECIGHEYYALEHHQIRNMNSTHKLMEGVMNTHDREIARKTSEENRWKQEAAYQSEVAAQAQRDRDKWQKKVGVLQNQLDKSQSDLGETQNALRWSQSDLRDSQNRFKALEKQDKEREREFERRHKELEREFQRRDKEREREFEKRDKESRLRIQRLEAEVRRLREKCMKQLEDRLRVTEERLKATEEELRREREINREILREKDAELRREREMNREYRDKIEMLCNSVDGGRSSNQDRIEQLEKALGVLTKWYFGLQLKNPPTPEE